MPLHPQGNTLGRLWQEARAAGINVPPLAQDDGKLYVWDQAQMVWIPLPSPWREQMVPIITAHDPAAAEALDDPDRSRMQALRARLNDDSLLTALEIKQILRFLVRRTI